MKNISSVLLISALAFNQSCTTMKKPILNRKFLLLTRLYLLIRL